MPHQVNTIFPRPARRARYLLISLGIHAALFCAAIWWQSGPSGQVTPARPLFVRFGAPKSEPAPPVPAPKAPVTPKPKKQVTATKEPAPAAPAETVATETQAVEAVTDEGTADVRPLADAVPGLSPVGEETSPARIMGTGSGGNMPRPPYPRWAREREWEGRIVLELEILTDGSVGEVSIIESTGHERLDHYTAEWAKWSLRFKPARLGDEPIVTHYRLSFLYDLKDARG